MAVKMKRILGLFLALVLIAMPLGNAFAQNTQTEYLLRDLVSKVNGELAWHQSTGDIVFELPTGHFVYNTESKMLTRNGIKWPLALDLDIRNGYTYVSEEVLKEVLALNDALEVIETQEVAMLPDALKNVQDKLKAYMVYEQWYELFDGQVLVAAGDTVLLHQAYGKADLSTDVLATVKDTYSVGSITKQFTAYGIMLLEFQGLLSYHDTLDKHLKDAPYGDQVTLHQLLTHTSGLPEYTDSIFLGIPLTSTEEIFEYIKNEPLEFEPGTKWSYCNSGYYLLGKVIESITQKSLIDYMHDQVFKPIGMENTHFVFENGEYMMTTAGSIQGDYETSRVMDDMLFAIAEGAGAIVSTVEDLYSWQRALYHASLFDQEVLDLMTGKVYEDGVAPYYGYGLTNVEYAYGYEFGHGGNTLGYTALDAYLEDYDVYILILSNRAYVDLNAIKNNLITILFGGEVSTEPTDYVTLSQEALKTFEGTYVIEGSQKIDIFEKDGKLMIQGEGQPAFELDAISDVLFESKLIGISLMFDDVHQPTAFTLYQSGEEYIAIKQ